MGKYTYTCCREIRISAYQQNFKRSKSRWTCKMVNQEQVPEMKRENNTNKYSSSSLMPEKRRCPSPDSLQVRAFPNVNISVTQNYINTANKFSSCSIDFFPLFSFSLFENRPFSFVYFLPQDYYNSLVSAAMKRNDADLQVVKPKLPSFEIKALK